MNKEIFSNIGKIIERDSKTATYKFALLRGVIDLIQDNSPYITHTDGRVHLPMGLLVEKWLIYYYPILAAAEFIPQINGEDTKLAFESQLKKLIADYEPIGGFSAFYNDLKNKGIPNELQGDFLALCLKVRETIVKNPMCYIGRSFHDEYYSIFQYSPLSRKKHHDSIDLEYLIDQMGYFSIPVDYYEAFQLLGSFINGQDALLFKWAEFSVKASRKNLTVNQVLNEVLKGPITVRDVEESKRIFRTVLAKEGKVYCVWTGKSVKQYDIDHLIPFSVWKNNDLWNLLPSDAKTNNQKRDKIPAVEMLEKRKELIFYYWEKLNEQQNRRFQKEIQVSLLGNSTTSHWNEKALEHLKNSCHYLITTRGYEEWKI